MNATNPETGMTWSEIGAGKYTMLTTYKKDGSPVGSPVWLAQHDDRIVVAANADSWKIKRIRRNPNVTLQLCNARGTATSGDVVDGHAEILDTVGTERARTLIRKKYGIVGALVAWTGKLRGPNNTVGISITAAAPQV
ncbi:PPOX class F420-dependent oxidoreductase [Nocardia sp. NPDC050793]|uniref:PPOX class F420-dependent oxidoreductase n=1 Tax=Nocardia sp. NPDC050793 TaxID=3155159 RepID=UPI0033DEDCE7